MRDETEPIAGINVAMFLLPFLQESPPYTSPRQLAGGVSAASFALIVIPTSRITHPMAIPPQL
jgi:hypothetical protein